MANFKPATRIIAALVIVFGIAGLLLLWNIQGQKTGESPQALPAPTNGSLAIGIDDFLLTPFNVLTIRGGGLDPDAATSIIFTTHLGEVITVPALKVTSAYVVVPVPPVAYNKTKGAFTPAQASVKVVQIKKEGIKMAVKTSNVIAGRMISAPTMPSAFSQTKIPLGAITQLVVAASIESLKSVAGKISPNNYELTATIAKTKKGMEQILLAVEKIMKNPKTTVKLTSNTGGSINFGATDVVHLDAFFVGYLGLLDQAEFSLNTEKTNIIIPVARAQTANACVESLLSNDLRIKQLDSLAIKLCNTIEPETGATVKLSDDEKNKMWHFEYLLQTPLLLALGLPEGVTQWNAEVAGWSVSKQVAIGTVLSMGFSYAYEEKLPDWWALGSLAATIYATKYNPFLAQVQFATDMWDNLCAVFPKSWQCLDTRTIILSSLQITRDLIDNPENLLYLANAMTGGMLQSKVDELYIPENAVSVVFDKIGKDKGGYEEVKPVEQKDSPAPISPEPMKVLPYTPTPKPPAPKPGLSCSQLKQSALTSCQNGCPVDDIGTYNQCTAGCESTGNLLTKANCINTCIGAWSKAKSDRSSCLTSCLNAYYATDCP